MATSPCPPTSPRVSRTFLESVCVPGVPARLLLRPLLLPRWLPFPAARLGMLCQCCVPVQDNADVFGCTGLSGEANARKQHEQEEAKRIEAKRKEAQDKKDAAAEEKARLEHWYGICKVSAQWDVWLWLLPLLRGQVSALRDVR